LVVEDNPVNAQMIQHFLKRGDYLVAGAAPTGEQAVAMAGELKPDLALMDVELAGEMDGIEAGRLIWERFHIPVVYLTGAEDEATFARAASTEAYGYLHKPVQERELSTTLRIALNKHDAELRVKERELWLQTTLQCIADAVIAADSVGCVKLINPAAEGLTGWKQEEAIGRDLLDVFRVLECETRQPADCAVVRVIRDGAAATGLQPRILVARDGTETTVEENAAPIVNDAGHIIGVVLVFRGIGVKVSQR
jgi:two-component system cell cycle sensor histidine kinase/response regulator CckA